MKEGFGTSSPGLEFFTSKLKDNPNFDFALASNFLANSPNTNSKGANADSLNGTSLWLNINTKIMKEKKKFNAEVSDMLVLEVLKRKELLIENNTSRDLTFSENKRNAWNDVRALLMENFPYFDLNVEAIKSHWRYRKRKVTDVYQDLKCTESESRIQNKVSAIDLAIFYMLKESNMLEKSSKNENSTASPSEGEDQGEETKAIDKFSSMDRCSLSVSPSSAFAQQQKEFQQHQQLEHHHKQQQQQFHNYQRQRTSLTLQQQFQQHFSGMLQQQNSVAAAASAAVAQKNILLPNLGASFPAHVNGAANAAVTTPSIALAALNNTGGGVGAASVVERLAAIFLLQQQQQRLHQQHEQQKQQNCQQQRSTSSQVDFDCNRPLFTSVNSNESEQQPQQQKDLFHTDDYSMNKKDVYKTEELVNVDEDDSKFHLSKIIDLNNNRGADINSCERITDDSSSATTHMETADREAADTIAPANAAKNSDDSIKNENNLAKSFNGFFKFASGMDNIANSLQNALREQQLQASQTQQMRKRRFDTDAVAAREGRSEKRRRCYSDVNCNQSTAMAEHNQSNDKISCAQIEANQMSVELCQKIAFIAQRNAYLELRAAILDVRRTLMPEMRLALRNFNGGFSTASLSSTWNLEKVNVGSLDMQRAEIQSLATRSCAAKSHNVSDVAADALNENWPLRPIPQYDLTMRSTVANDVESERSRSSVNNKYHSNSDPSTLSAVNDNDKSLLDNKYHVDNEINAESTAESSGNDNENRNNNNNEGYNIDVDITLSTNDDDMISNDDDGINCNNQLTIDIDENENETKVENQKLFDIHSAALNYRQNENLVDKDDNNNKMNNDDIVIRDLNNNDKSCGRS